MKTKVYGYSDDLVEIEQDNKLYKEIDCFMQKVLITFKDETRIKVGYPKPEGAIWWIEVLKHGSGTYTLEYCHDEDAKVYSDVFQIDSELKSVRVV